ncbi:MAG: sigma-70 family RNA polymerase sigma factor [Victivallales bacterium]|nr:sigma-70 family RNA polymerase sigma factor [Victivallales bacterium]
MAYTTKHTMLERMRSGEDAAWTEFQTFYRSLILFLGRLCGLTVAESNDLVQEVMVACFKEHVLENYDSSKCKFRSYLRTIVKRKAEAMKAARPMGQVELGEEYPDENAFETQWEAEWQKAIQEKALQELRDTIDSRKFMMFELHALQGRPRDVVAQMTGTTESQVSLTSTRVKKRLEKLVERIKKEFE